MPSDNDYNRMIAHKLNATARKHIAMENAMNENPASFVEPHSQQEFMSVEHPEVVGGSGNLAATSFDLGYDAKKVGGNVVVKENKKRRTKLEKAVEGKGKPMEHTQEATVVKGAGRKRRTKKGGDFEDIMNGIKSAAGTVGEVVKTAAAVAPYVAPLVGLGKKREPSEWLQLVKKVRSEKNLNLRDTLKYIKEHNLYKRKGTATADAAPKTRKPRAKKEQGGSAQLPFVVDRIEKGDVKATVRKTGGAPSLKHASGNQPPDMYGGAAPPPVRVRKPRVKKA